MGSRFRVLSALLVAVIGTGLSSAQWAPQERAALREAMSIGNLAESDLLWDRRPFRDPWRMPFVDFALDQPLESSNRILTDAETIMKSSAPTILRAFQGEFGDVRDLKAITPPEALPAGAYTGPAELQSIVVPLVVAIGQANAEIRASLEGLTVEERRALIDSLPSLTAEEFTPQIAFVRQRPMALRQALDLMAKVDLQRIVRASAMLGEAVDRASIELRGKNLANVRGWSGRVAGRVVRIAGKGNDIHRDTDSSLFIDLGGNDTYAGRHGAGVGYASVLIDLGGDDIYEPIDLSTGSAILGIGWVRDEQGNDVYRTRTLALGSALAGVGVHIDAQGNDSYRSTMMAQGFSSFGVGLLLDAQGDDHYELSLYGQGASRTRGVGILVDRSGRDLYRAGGSALNQPLFETVHYSFAQGFSMGYRDDRGGTSGGMGFLFDGAGDDAYIAETYAQGASYWFGLGVLWDRSGNDRYNAHHYSQASAMHMTAAFLFDLAGDDGYLVNFGACHAIGHDYGVAVLLDRAGNDVYAARDSNPAVGNANGLAIFVDAAGDDRYAGPPGRGNAARGSGSLALFVDVTGQDRYAAGLQDASATVTDAWGLAFDLETPRTRTDRPEPLPEPVVGSEPMPTDAVIAEIYRKASQWGFGTAQRDVEVHLNRLVNIGLPAVRWMLDNRLSQADRLQIRAFVHVIRAVGPEARQLLAQRVVGGNVDEKRNGLSIAVDGRFTELAPAVPLLIDNPSLRTQAVRAAGALGSKESVGRLIPLVRDAGSLGLAAMVSLAQIGDESAFSTAEVLYRSGSLPMRKAAQQLLAQFPLRASELARSLMAQPETRDVRFGMELLGAVGTPEGLEEIASRLLDPIPGVRIQALLSLNGRCPEGSRLTFVSLRNDPDPTVRAVAVRVDPGR